MRGAGDCLLSGEMMSKSIAVILMLIVPLLLGGCALSYHGNLVSKLQAQGPNPYINEPELKDLYRKIRVIAMAERSWGDPYAFDSRNDAIISNFQDRFSKPAMMEAISLVREGYDAVVAARYPHIGYETECTLVDAGAYVVNTEVAADQFDWNFIKGECVGGLAHGVGKAVDEKNNAQFVGRFDQGVMVEGVFDMPLENGSQVTQLGDVPGKARIARLLSTETREDGFQWHRYGDFNDRAEMHGFGVVIWGYTNAMIVKSMGEFKHSKLNGFAAKQVSGTTEAGAVWYVRIGEHVEGELNGAGAWTNGVTSLSVGYWEEGKLNGKGYGDYANVAENSESYAGTYLAGKRQGSFTVRRRAQLGGGTGEFTEIYDNGKLIDDGIEEKSNSGDGFGKFVALAGGAAVIGSSGISDSSKVDIGTAFASDVMAGGDGKNMNAMSRQVAQGGGAASQVGSDDDKGVFQFSCYDPGNFICVDYTLFSRAKSEQFKAQCAQGRNKQVASCDSSTRQAICSHQSPTGDTETHDYLYGSEPEQVKQACLSTGGKFRMVE